MQRQEPIDCLVVAGRPKAFSWRGAMYEVSRVIHTWWDDDEWWNSCYFVDTRFWVVEVRNATQLYMLRQDPDSGWWMLLDMTAQIAA